MFLNLNKIIIINKNLLKIPKLKKLENIIKIIKIKQPYKKYLVFDIKRFYYNNIKFISFIYL